MCKMFNTYHVPRTYQYRIIIRFISKNIVDIDELKKENDGKLLTLILNNLPIDV